MVRLDGQQPGNFQKAGFNMNLNVTKKSAIEFTRNLNKLPGVIAHFIEEEM
jgi:hypothetical protein